MYKKQRIFKYIAVIILAVYITNDISAAAGLNTTNNLSPVSRFSNIIDFHDDLRDDASLLLLGKKIEEYLLTYSVNEVTEWVQDTSATL